MMEQKVNMDQNLEKITFSQEEILRHIETLLEIGYVAFSEPEFKEDLNYSKKLFFDIRHDEELAVEELKPMDQNNYLIWLMCDYVLKEQGKPFLAYLLESEEAEIIPVGLRKIADALVASRISLYDVMSVDKEAKTLTLRELFTLKGLRLEDSRLIELASSPVFFGLRIIKVNDVNYSVGDLYVYPEELKENLSLIHI